jgi:peptidoglycan/LPS O-acetylase OafA/YrhL
MQPKKLYYPQLDAIRGLSFLVVFFFHAFQFNTGTSFLRKLFIFLHSNMCLGLEVFFVLSAFLLTLLGLNEFEKTGSFSFKNYFLRRALRIWPLYYLIMFFAFVVLRIAQNYAGIQLSIPPAPWYLFFISNFYTPDHLFFLRVLWTLSVEEQFYILWGFCLLFFQKKLVIVMLLLASISLVYICWGAYNFVGVYFNSLTYLFDMMAGAYTAYLFKNNSHVLKYIKKLIGIKSILFYSFLPALFFIVFLIDMPLDKVNHNRLNALQNFIFVIYICLVIIDQMVNTSSIVKLSKQKLLVFTGKISYGLYCFHGLVIGVTAIFFKKLNIELPSFINVIFLLGVTFLCAIISYKFVEKPFLSLKDKLRGKGI